MHEPLFIGAKKVFVWEILFVTNIDFSIICDQPEHIVNFPENANTTFI